MNKLLTLTISLLFLLVILGGLAVIFAPQFIPTEKIKEQIIVQAKTKLGYDVAFSDDIGIGIFPSPRAVIKNLTVSANEDEFLKASEIKISLGLSELLHKEINITGLSVIEPHIAIKNTGDQANWKTKELEALLQKPANKETSPQSKTIMIKAFEIEQGTLSLASDGKDPLVIKQLDLNGDAKTLKGPYSVKGQATANSQTINFDADIKPLNGDIIPMELELAASPMGASLAYNGSVNTKTKSVDGSMNVKIGSDIIRANIKGNPERVTLSDLDAKAKNYAIGGQVTLNTKMPIDFNGNLTVNGTPIQTSGKYNAGKGLTIAVKSQNLNIDKLTGTSPNASEKGGKLSTAQIKGQAKAVASKIPFPVAFDVQTDALTLSSQTYNNVILKGDINSSSLLLKTAQAALPGISTQGTLAIENLKEIAGINADIKADISDIQKAAQFLKFDASKLPADMKTAKADIKASGSIDALNIAADINTLGGNIIAKGMIENPLSGLKTDSLNLQVKHPNANDALKIFSASAPSYDSWNRPLALGVNLKTSGKTYSLSAISGQIGGTTVAGNAKIDLSSAKPAFSGDLNFGDMALRSANAKPAGGAAKNSTSTGKQWSQKTIRSEWLSAVNLDLDIKASSLIYDSWDVKSPSIKLSMQNGVLNISNLKGGLYGGTINMDAIIKSANPSSGQGLNIASNISFDNVNLEKQIGSFVGKQVLQTKGSADLKTSLASQGVSQAALVSNLTGNGTISGSNISIEGFDVSKFVNALALDQKPGNTLMGLYETTTRGGSTVFDMLDGAFTVNNGIATIDKLNLTGKTANINTTGTADLPKWYLNAKAVISAVGSDAPPFTLNISGPLDNPAKNLAQGAIQNYFQQKINRKLDKVISDKLNLEQGGAPIEQKVINKLLQDKLGDKLKLPGATTPQSSPQPANDNVPEVILDDTSGASAPVQDAPQSEPQKELQPEDILNEAIKQLF